MFGHPLRDRFAAMRLRWQAAAMGLTEDQMKQIPDDVLLGAANEAAKQVAVAKGMAEGTSRPILDALGNFFQSIFDWIKSPDGQAFLSALAKILLSLLAGA